MDDTNVVLLLKQLQVFLNLYEKNQAEHMEMTPAQSYLLGTLLDQKEQQICSAKLSAEIGLSRATISATLKNLKKKGYIELNTDSDDNRRKCIVLTKKAYTAERQTRDLMQGSQSCLCKGLSAAELCCVEQGLKHMLENLQRETIWRIDT